MTNSKFPSSNASARTWILLGIPVLFILGSLMHFVYEWSGNLTLVGLFAPINESVWEHLKLTFWPMLIWWIVGYSILGKNNKISATQWFFSCAIASLVCPLIIVSFYYTYTGVFGIESLILDIFSLFLGIMVAQILALHIYKYANLSYGCFYFAIFLILLLALAFTIFTFNPPHIPLFKDSLTGTYGI